MAGTRKRPKLRIYKQKYYCTDVYLPRCLRHKFSHAAVFGCGNFSNFLQSRKICLFITIASLLAVIVGLENVKSSKNAAILALFHTISRIFAQTEARKIFQPAIFMLIE